MVSAERTEIRSPLPAWVPDAARIYLAHTVGGTPIRAIARAEGCHASTVLRQVRRLEVLRDDPLIDHALNRLGRMGPGPSGPGSARTDDMTITEARTITPSDDLVTREAARILRRMAEPGACLAVAEGMEKAVVVRDAPDGQTLRTAVVEAEIAECMALRGWIGASESGRIVRYRLRPAGRQALKEMLAEGERSAADKRDRDAAEAASGRIRYGMADSPLLTLSRRRERDGSPFLDAELVRAGERLREDVELAALGSGGAPDWTAFLETGELAGGFPDTAAGRAARRVASALDDLGPGLADIVLAVCGRLEGLEAVEQRMGWAARSGKIVLRIALQRLYRHNLDTAGKYAPLIG